MTSIEMQTAQRVVSVSVVIPLYNAEQYIAETITSVQAQTFSDFEIVVVNHACTDSSVSVVEDMARHDNRIRIVHMDTNFGGPAWPRNTGIREAKGEYIALLDADDVWLPQKLQTQIDFMKKHNLDFCSTDVVRIDDKSVPMDTSLWDKLARTARNRFAKAEPSVADLFFFNQISTSSTIVRRDVFDRYTFKEDPLLITKEDLFLWLQLTNDSTMKYRYLNQKLSSYRVIETSLTNDKQLDKDRVRHLYCICRYIMETRSFSLWGTLKKLFILRILRK